MKTVRTSAGPFRERPFYAEEEIERTCTQALRSVDLLPSSPEPIRIDRFIEKRFKVTPEYEDTASGVLGFTEFGVKGVERIVASKQLSEQEDSVSRRRLNTTLAHESGHGLFHAHLFLLNDPSLSLFEGSPDVDATKILCRDKAVSTGGGKKISRYDGRWWEFQANRAMGSLLLPKELVLRALNDLLESDGTFGGKRLPSKMIGRAVDILSPTFDVNPIVASIRINQIFSAKDRAQLSL